MAEDTAVNQLVLRNYLEANGHKVEIADNGRQAVAACRTHPFDLVLMDVQMPEMDGIEAARIIRDQLPPERQMPIVALTANADIQTRNACLAAGMDAVLTKPIRREMLLAAVQDRLKAVRMPGNDPQGEGARRAMPESDAGHTEKQGPPLDLEAAIYEFGDRKLVQQVVDQLILSGTGQIREIRQALALHETNIIRQRAHALKGGAATAEAGPLALAASELEEACATDRPELIPAALDRLSAAFDGLRQYVQGIDWQ